MSKLRDKREKRKHRGSGERVKKVASERRQWEPSTLNVPANVPLFYLKDAEPKRLDILDYIVGKGNPKADEGEPYYERRFWIHRGFGADGKQAFVCTARTFGKKCAGCDYVAKQSKNPDADPDYIKSLMPKERQLLNVIDRKEIEKGVQVWETSWHNFGKLLELKIQNQDEDDNYHNFAQWEGGLTLKCDIEDDKTYGKSVASIEFKPRKDYDPEEIEDKVHCLDDLIKEPTYKEQQKIVQGMEEESEEDEDTKPTFKESDVKKIKNLTEKELKKFIITNELDEGILEMDTLEEMREAVVDEIKAALDEKPAKVGKKPKKKVEDDEEEEEEEEEEDEDEDKEESDDDEEEEEEEEESEDEDEDEDKEESDDDEEEEEEEEPDDDDDEEEEEKPKKRRGRPSKKK